MAPAQRYDRRDASQKRRKRVLILGRIVRVMGGLRTGTAVVIISPTRELALQIFQVASDLMKYHHQTFGIIMGGANRYDGRGAARGG